MRTVTATRLALCLGVALLLVCFTTSSAATQDPNLAPTYGSVTLRAGFMPDPYGVNVVAGGSVRTTLGGVPAWVAHRPDYRLFYHAGNFPLTFFVESAADTTLLINLPNGTWVANDDGGSGRNPMIRLPAPMSGRYDIFVGTYNRGTAGARLYITEMR